jgi:hypothetical protein
VDVSIHAAVQAATADVFRAYPITEPFGCKHP